jgi:hypothetical protein
MVLAGSDINNQPLSGIAIGIFLISLGGVLALDVGGISTTLHQQHERPDREQNSAGDINWYTVGGRIFAVGGIFFLVIGIVYAV